MLLAEHNCWPWAQRGMRPAGQRPRGVSMAYMENETFWALGEATGGRVTVRGSEMCDELRRRSGAGALWENPNSGANHYVNVPNMAAAP